MVEGLVSCHRGTLYRNRGEGGGAIVWNHFRLRRRNSRGNCKNKKYRGTYRVSSRHHDVGDSDTGGMVGVVSPLNIVPERGEDGGAIVVVVVPVRPINQLKKRIITFVVVVVVVAAVVVVVDVARSLLLHHYLRTTKSRIRFFIFRNLGGCSSTNAVSCCCVLL